MTGFDPNQGVLTYTPARGFRGVDRFTYHADDSATSSSSALVVLNVVAPPDTDANGLPDAWEAAYGITNPNADNDGDGQSNLAEYRANTNPTNAASALRILGVERQPGGAITLRWSSVGGTRYRVQYSDGGAAGPFMNILRSIEDEMDNAPCGQGSTQSFTDPAPASGVRFYRIRLVP